MLIARLGSRVALIDADIGPRNLDLLLGLETRVLYIAMDVFEAECRLEQALIRDEYLQDHASVTGADGVARQGSPQLRQRACVRVHRSQSHQAPLCLPQVSSLWSSRVRKVVHLQFGTDCSQRWVKGLGYRV